MDQVDHFKPKTPHLHITAHIWDALTLPFLPAEKEKDIPPLPPRDNEWFQVVFLFIKVKTVTFQHLFLVQACETVKSLQSTLPINYGPQTSCATTQP